LADTGPARSNVASFLSGPWALDPLVLVRMRPYVVTIALLVGSNVFMTFAWYGHLKTLASKTWLVAALVSWGIALFEYLLQVPANRQGHAVMDVGQLKILQEVIALSVFVPFSVLYLKQLVTWDYAAAGLCILAAAFFIFKRPLAGA